MGGQRVTGLVGLVGVTIGDGEMSDRPAWSPTPQDLMFKRDVYYWRKDKIKVIYIIFYSIFYSCVSRLSADSIPGLPLCEAVEILAAQPLTSTVKH